MIPAALAALDILGVCTYTMWERNSTLDEQRATEKATVRNETQTLEDPMPKLTFAERWILHNQYEILERPQ